MPSPYLYADEIAKLNSILGPPAEPNPLERARVDTATRAFSAPEPDLKDIFISDEAANSSSEMEMRKRAALRRGAYEYSTPLLQAELADLNTKDIDAEAKNLLEFPVIGAINRNPLARTIGAGTTEFVGDLASMAVRAAELPSDLYFGPSDNSYADKINQYTNRVEQVAQSADRQANPNIPEIVLGSGRSATRSVMNAYTAAGAGQAIGLGAKALPYAISTAFGANRANQAVTEGRQAGLEGADLAKYVTTAGIIEGGMEAAMQALPLPTFEKMLTDPSVTGGTIKTAVSYILKTMGVEISQEIPQELIDQANQKWYGVDPSEWTKEQFWQIVGQTALATAMQTGGAGAIQVSQSSQQMPQIRADAAATAAEGMAGPQAPDITPSKPTTTAMFLDARNIAPALAAEFGKMGDTNTAEMTKGAAVVLDKLANTAPDDNGNITVVLPDSMLDSVSIATDIVGQMAEEAGSTINMTVQQGNGNVTITADIRNLQEQQTQETPQTPAESTISPETTPNTTPTGIVAPTPVSGPSEAGGGTVEGVGQAISPATSQVTPLPETQGQEVSTGETQATTAQSPPAQTQMAKPGEGAAKTQADYFKSDIKEAFGLTGSEAVKKGLIRKEGSQWIETESMLSFDTQYDAVKEWYDRNENQRQEKKKAISGARIVWGWSGDGAGRTYHVWLDGSEQFSGKSRMKALSVVNDLESSTNTTAEKYDSTLPQGFMPPPPTTPQQVSKGKERTITLRANPPQVAQPTVLESRVPVEVGPGRTVYGKGYALPGIEGLQVVLVPPRGSKAKSDAVGWSVWVDGVQVYHNLKGGEMDTIQQALSVATPKLKQIAAAAKKQAKSTPAPTVAESAPVDAKPATESAKPKGDRQGPLESGPSTRIFEMAIEPGGKPQSAQDLIKYMSRAFNIPIRGKATFHKRALGWFDPHSTGIRMQDVADLTTAMHEVGHHVDWTINNRWSLNQPSPTISKELVSLGKLLYGKRKPPGGYKSEGWAEYTRAYMTDQDTATMAPELDKWFRTVFLPQKPDLAAKIAQVKGMMDNWRMQGAEARMDSQISWKEDKGTIGERAARSASFVNDSFRDELAPIRRGLKAAGIKESDLDPTKSPIQIAVGRADTAQAVAAWQVEEYTTNLAGKRTGESLKDAIAPVAGDIKAWARWAMAARARNLEDRGINSGFQPKDIAYVYNKYDSEKYQDVLQRVTDWNHRLLDYMVDAGALSADEAAAIKKANPIYIPFFREFAPGELNKSVGGGRAITKGQKPIKGIRGSGRKAIEPIESMIRQSVKLISAAHKAEVRRAIAQLAEIPGTSPMLEEVPAPIEATTFSAEQIKSEIIRIASDRLGVDDSELASAVLDDWDELITVFTQAKGYYGKDNIASFIVDGKRRYFELAPDVFRAVEGLDQYTLPKVLDWVLGKPTRAVRLGATGLNASFGLIRNTARDMMTFTVQSKHAKLGPLSAVSGIVADVANTEAAKQFKALGGKMSSQILADRKSLKSIRNRILIEDTKGKTFYTVAHPVDALRELFGVTEAGTRIGEFSAALEYAEKRWGKGSEDAALYALNAGKDVTTNFTRHGRMAKVLNQMIPFFNAAIQGPDKMVRTFAERPMTTTVKAVAALMMPAVFSWWQNHDEDWWKNMTDEEKYGYFHFRIPGTDRIIRLPIPFELGYIFASMPIAALEKAFGDNPAAVNEMLDVAIDQSNPFSWPAVIAPVIDTMKNENYFGTPIIPPSVEHKLPEDQYTKNTTALMKIIGKQIGVSPMKLEYWATSYSGGLYNRVATQLENMDPSEWEPADYPVIGTLFMREAYAPRKQVEQFYDKLELFTKKKGSGKITEDEDATRLELQRKASDMGKLWKELRNKNTDPEKERIYRQMKDIIANPRPSHSGWSTSSSRPTSRPSSSRTSSSRPTSSRPSAR